MKKIYFMKYTLGIVLILVFLTTFPVSAMINPAAGYCHALGYTYSTKLGDQGETGYCILPNGQSVDAWDFVLGRTAQDYGYCAKIGYSTRVVNDSKICEIYGLPTCAACVFPNGSAEEITALMNLDFREKICFNNTCRDPKDYPLPPPILIPPVGGANSSPLPSWLFMVGALLIIIIAGIFLLIRKKEKSK